MRRLWSGWRLYLTRHPHDANCIPEAVALDTGSPALALQTSGQAMVDSENCSVLAIVARWMEHGLYSMARGKVDSREVIGEYLDGQDS